METVGYEIKAIPGNDKMHLVLTKHTGRLIDPDSGEARAYTFFGSGQDNGDKGLYKAITGALKYFLASTFLVAEYNDPERDDAPSQQTTRPATPEQREAAKQAVTDTTEPPTQEQAEAIKTGLAMLQQANAAPDTIEKVKRAIGQTKTREDAGKLIEIIGKLLQPKE
jgi:hypothetical protein